MNKATVVVLVILLAACSDPSSDRDDQDHVAEGYEQALDKARQARSDAEEAMEAARREIEDNQPEPPTPED